MGVHFKEVQRTEKIFSGFTCGKCKRCFGNDEDGIWEMQEFLHKEDVGGYGSVFGDGSRWSITLCQRCVIDTLGDYIEYHDDSGATTAQPHPDHSETGANMSGIVGYQVVDQIHGQHWNDRPSFHILTQETALAELHEARASTSGCWTMITILDGDIEEPTWELEPVSPGASAVDGMFDICFDVTGTARQTLKIMHPDYTPELILAGLKSGSLCTTTGHDEFNQSTVDITLTGETVALVVDSQIDGEYDEFELADE